jgi:hypothetical protein
MLQFVPGSNHNDAAFIYHRCTGAGATCEFMIVRDVKKTDFLRCRRIVKNLEQGLGRQAVKRTRRLIRNEQRGFRRKGASQSDALPFSAAQSRRKAVEQFSPKSNAMQKRFNMFIIRGFSCCVYAFIQRFTNCLHRVEGGRVVLKEQLHGCGPVRDTSIRTMDANQTLRRSEKSCNASRERCLPASASADQRERFPLFHRQRYIPQDRSGRAVRAGHGERNSIYFQ